MCRRDTYFFMYPWKVYIYIFVIIISAIVIYPINVCGHHIRVLRCCMSMESVKAIFHQGLSLFCVGS